MLALGFEDSNQLSLVPLGLGYTVRHQTMVAMTKWGRNSLHGSHERGARAHQILFKDMSQ